MPNREILDVVNDLYRNTVMLWQPVLVVLGFKLVASLTALCRPRCLIARGVDWLATWTLIAVILLIVQTAVRF